MPTLVQSVDIAKASALTITEYFGNRALSHPKRNYHPSHPTTEQSQEEPEEGPTLAALYHQKTASHHCTGNREKQWSIENQEDTIIRSLEEEVKTNHGFIPDLNLSIIQNASVVIGKAVTLHYFSRPNHLALHDLTKGKVVSNIVNQVLGLSRKIIPVKKHSIGTDELEQSFHDFKKDSHLKTFFADSSLDQTYSFGVDIQ